MSIIGDTAADQLSGLVDLLGITRTTTNDNRTRGLTSTIVPANDIRQVDLFDKLSHTSGSNDSVGATVARSKGTAAQFVGSYLTRAAPVSEPNAVTLLGIALAGLGFATRRSSRRKR